MKNFISPPGPTPFFTVALIVALLSGCTKDVIPIVTEAESTRIDIDLQSETPNFSDFPALFSSANKYHELSEDDKHLFNQSKSYVSYLDYALGSLQLDTNQIDSLDRLGIFSLVNKDQLFYLGDVLTRYDGKSFSYFSELDPSGITEDTKPFYSYEMVRKSNENKRAYCSGSNALKGTSGDREAWFSYELEVGARPLRAAIAPYAVLGWYMSVVVSTDVYGKKKSWGNWKHYKTECEIDADLTLSGSGVAAVRYTFQATNETRHLIHTHSTPEQYYPGYYPPSNFTSDLQIHEVIWDTRGYNGPELSHTCD